MFNNLIESSSHAKEFKRRGSFLLFTTATYLVLFAITGVISIYAYDAHLEVRNSDSELLYWVPVPPTEAAPVVVRNTIQPSANSATTPTRSTRTELIDSTSNPNNAPAKPGTIASPVPPATSESVLDTTNQEPPARTSNNRAGSGSGTGTGNTPVVKMPDPPPAPDPTPVVPKVLKISVVLNSRALSLPKPNYPALARQIGLRGTVTVQVLIDETGKVISAKAVAGHPVLIPEAQRAAMQARFSPTVISDHPVKVSGMITYNFVMQ
jgi:TonB family protein